MYYLYVLSKSPKIGLEMKKLFHKHKDDSPTQTSHRRDVSASNVDDPNVRGIPYASATPGGLRETVTGPSRGSRDAGSRAPEIVNLSDRPMSIQRYPDSPTSGRPFPNAPPDSGLADRRSLHAPFQGSNTPMAQEFSGLNIGDDAEPYGM